MTLFVGAVVTSLWQGHAFTRGLVPRRGRYLYCPECHTYLQVAAFRPDVACPDPDEVHKEKVWLVAYEDGERLW